MPITPTYPGVYIEEVPSGVRTITGVATSITAFVGRALRGPEDEPVRIASYGDYERIFGGLWVPSTMSYAVQQYYQNGGADAIIVRVTEDTAAAATVSLTATTSDPLVLDASSTGTWGNMLLASVDYVTRDPTDTTLFNLTIEDTGTGNTESFLNVSIDPASSRLVTLVLAQESALAKVDETAAFPTARPDVVSDSAFSGGTNGAEITDADILGSQANKTGIYALEDADLFNLLCIPPRDRDEASFPLAVGTLETALLYCKDRRAMLVADPPPTWNTAADVDLAETVAHDENAVIYFPRLRSPDPNLENRLVEFVPCGAVAGIMSRTDAARGVWKAPAGIETTLNNVPELSYKLTDAENGTLNPIGVNCLRSFPVIGRVVWGSRTLEGADRLASEWKYLPVRRLALFLEESLFRGTQWVVFEPNDEPLWAQIRLNLGAFMQSLFVQGAFQGTTPQEAYFVKCDKETTTQNDINLGIVNIVVGFAPLKPAEFVIIKLQQIAGQV